MTRAVLAALLTLALTGCGDPQTPPPPPGPFDRHYLNDTLWWACTPAGDRLYGDTGSHSNIGLAVVAGGCRP